MDDSNPQFNPLPPVDPFVEECKETLNADKDKDDAPKGGGKVTLSYKPEADLHLSSGELNMEYLNPETSSHDAVVSLYVLNGNEEYLVASSGRIPAGNRLKTMQLSADASLFGGEGKYDAKYKVSYYDPVTGEKALAEANVEDITLMVRNS